MKALNILVVGLAIALTGCQKNPVKPAENPIGLPAAGKNFLTVQLSNFSASQSGYIERIDLRNGSRLRAAAPIFQNSVFRRLPSLPSLFAVNRYPNDNIQIHNFATLALEKGELTYPYEEVPGAKASFQDLALWTDGFRQEAYLTRLNSRRLFKIDLRTGAGAEWHSLQNLADGDTFPELNNLIVVGDRLFVQALRFDAGMDRKKTPWIYSAHSSIAVIDLKNDFYEGHLQQTLGSNAGSEFKIGPQGKLYYATAGDWNLPCADCGIETLDPNDKGLDKKSDGYLIREENLRTADGKTLGHIAEFEFSDTKGFVWTRKIPSVDGGIGTRIVSFNLRNVDEPAQVLDDTNGKDGYESLLYDKERDLLYAGSGNPSQPGIQVFDAKNGAKTIFIPTELTPKQLLLTE